VDEIQSEAGREPDTAPHEGIRCSCGWSSGHSDDSEHHTDDDAGRHTGDSKRQVGVIAGEDATTRQLTTGGKGLGRYLLAASGLVIVLVCLPPLLFLQIAHSPDWGQFWSAAAQPYATFGAGIAAITAGGLAFWNGERSRKFDRENQAVSNEKETRRDLHARFSAAATQLSEDDSLIRQAGVYALSALADDWAALDDPGQQRVCVDLLSNYLRSAHERSRDADSDRAVRQTIMEVTAEHHARTGRTHWCHIDLNDADLSSLLLANMNLRGVNFENANLSSANLIFADMIGARLRGANLSSADLTATDFTNADLTLADLQGAQLRRTKFVSAALFGSNLASTFILERADGPVSSDKLNELIEQAPSFTNAYLMGARLVDCNLTGARFDSARMEAADLTNATLVHASLKAARLELADLRGADMTGADLTGITLSGTHIDSGTNWPHESGLPVDEYGQPLGTVSHLPAEELLPD